jgi:hypothetical protein
VGTGGAPSSCKAPVHREARCDLRADVAKRIAASPCGIAAAQAPLIFK